MKQTGNTILITGGSSGIGLELAAQLHKKGNSIIICGRSETKLQKVKDRFPGIECIRCDLSEPEACNRLADRIRKGHPACNVLINNAAVVHKGSLPGATKLWDKARVEMDVNFLAPVRLIKNLMAVLEQNPSPHIINITTGLAFVPRAAYPFYNATKAALHSFTLVLREQLKQSPFRVTEVMFPAVDTPWHRGNPPDIAISPQKAVDDMLRGLAGGREEILVGKVKALRTLSRIAPAFAFKKVNSLSQ